MNQLTPLKSTELETTNLVEQTKKYIAAEKSENTRKLYKVYWAQFEAFCDKHGLPSLPATPGAVALFITDLAESGKSVATIQASIASISYACSIANQPIPTKSVEVRSTLRGIRRMLTTDPKQKRPLMIHDLRKVVDALPNTLQGKRDRAILTLSFAAALRRSECAGLKSESVQEVAEGLMVKLARSKTSQEHSTRIGVAYGSRLETCPVRSLRSWKEALAEHGITDGALFRRIDRHGRIGSTTLSGNAMADIVRRACKRVGLDPKEFGHHSLRAGLISTAAQQGIQERVIALQSRHRSLVVLRGYIRRQTIFRDNVSSMVGL